MSEEATPVEGSAPEGSESEAVGVVSGESASAGGGDAPATGGDAQAGEEAVAGETPAPETTSAAFRILNREFRDQKHAEEVLGSEIGAKRGLQRQNADLSKQLERLQAQVDDYQTRLRGDGSSPGGQKSKQEATAERFSEHLVKSGELDFYNKLAQNPEIGVAGAILEAMKAQEDWQSKHADQRFEALEQQITQGEVRRSQEATMARAFTATKELIKDFPELDDVGPDASDEAFEERAHIHQMVMTNLQSTPQAIHPVTGQLVPSGVLWLSENPGDAIRWAVEKYRREYGTPVFAKQPGTSESPSAKAAAAAERKAAAASAEPLDGSGVPRQREGDKKPKTLAERWREDSQQLKGQEAQTPSGRRLGFSA